MGNRFGEVFIIRIGLVDVDGHNFPSLPLMKLSAWHKRNRDEVKWYEPLLDSLGEPLDRVYMSKVFSFTQDCEYCINAKEIVTGGTGYAIRLADGKEVFDKRKDKDLPYEVEHIYPDYSLYPELTKDRAFGFLSRGCPRDCDFCHVGCKEGLKSYKVADLSEFWRGQKEIVLLDPNLLACPDAYDLLEQLAFSRAKVDITQGLDARFLNDRYMKIINRIRLKMVHFAWDRIEDEDVIVPKLRYFREHSDLNIRNMTVYVLVNYDTTLEQDLHRIYMVRDLGMTPYVMIYDKEHSGRTVKDLARWVNNRYIWRSNPNGRFEDYQRTRKVAS